MLFFFQVNYKITHELVLSSLRREMKTTNYDNHLHLVENV